jgi:PPK2 family polyphosphate:nucleotide phosphotransferase
VAARDEHIAKHGRLRDRLRVKPGTRVDLEHFDPRETYGREREAADLELAEGLVRLGELQDRLWAQAQHAVLVVLQGIDAAGKDGTIRHVMSAFNPMGCPVTSFKVPTSEELGHDYLWRVHRHTPAKGEIAIFNRSHYEDVLVVRVHETVPKETWSRRFDQINAWEHTLVEEGTTVVKFFLAIDRDEQGDRLRERVEDPTKRWKFRRADLAERALWDAYRGAFEDALTRCSTDWAPWYLVPSNRKWFRNLAVADVLADVIEDLAPAYPPGEPGIERLSIT